MPLYGPVWVTVMRRDQWTCQYCGARATELDHIIPLIWGGSDAFSNQVASCHTCNQIASGDLFCDLEDKKRFIMWMRDRGRTWRGPSSEDRCRR